MIRLVRGVILAGIGCVVLGCGPQQEMHDAIKSGDVQSVRRHLQRGYDPNTIDAKARFHDDGPMLMTVSEFCSREEVYGSKQISPKYVEMAEMFLKAGADIDGHDDKGDTPLVHAVRLKCTDLARFLIERGADVNTKDYRDFTVLHQAAASYLYEICELLVAKGADVNARDADGGTAIALAATGGRDGWEDIVRLFLRNGADYTTPRNDGFTVNLDKIQTIADAMEY